MDDARAFDTAIYDYNRCQVDPITFEVIHHRLISISEEQAATLSAISGSPLVNDASDFNTGIYRAHGEIVTLGKTVLFHAASIAEMIKHIIADCQVKPGIREGDMFLVNHPYKGALHAPDFAMVAPIFHDGKRIAWVGVCAHQIDVGGMSPGGNAAQASEAYQEGMLVPPVRIVENDEIREDIMAMVLGMSRAPTNLGLDFRGMMAANRVAIKRLRDTINQYGIDTVLSVMDGAIDLSEQAIRARLRELPDGVFRSQKFLDHDGIENKLYRVSVEITKKGDHLTLDFTKSADQAPRFMNCTESGLHAGLRAGILPILAYDLAWNEGVFRPMTVKAREGSIVSARFPAPVGQGPTGAMWLVEMVVTEALSKMVSLHPKYISEAQASPNGGPDGFNVVGMNQHGERTQGGFFDNLYVGGGAYSHRDGLSPQGHRHIPAIRLQNCERNESLAPILYMYRRFMTDTAGAGRMRGGLSVGHGYILHDVKSVETRFACHCYESPISTGMFGGYPSATNTRHWLRDTRIREEMAAGRIPYEFEVMGGRLQEMPAKVQGLVDFNDDDFIERAPSAGGGWGDPIEREPELVAEDVEDGAVSMVMANEVYGVVLKDDFTVDSDATDKRRNEIRAARLKWPVNKTVKNAPAANAMMEEVALFGDRAKFVRTGGHIWLRCDCGHIIGPTGENWKNYARQSSSAPGDLSTRMRIHEELEVIRYACPSCARLHEVEVKLKTEAPLFDIEFTA